MARKRTSTGTNFTGSPKPETPRPDAPSNSVNSGSPEPFWDGRSRGPESLRWLEWARQNGATQPSPRPTGFTPPRPSPFKPLIGAANFGPVGWDPQRPSTLPNLTPSLPSATPAMRHYDKGGWDKLEAILKTNDDGHPVNSPLRLLAAFKELDQSKDSALKQKVDGYIKDNMQHLHRLASSPVYAYMFSEKDTLEMLNKLSIEGVKEIIQTYTNTLNGAPPVPLPGNLQNNNTTRMSSPGNIKISTDYSAPRTQQINATSPLDRLDQITQGRDIFGNEIKTADMLVSGGVKLQKNQRADRGSNNFSGLQFRNISGQTRVVGTNQPRNTKTPEPTLAMGQQQPDRGPATPKRMASDLGMR
jgi:hypothetical protein